MCVNNEISQNNKCVFPSHISKDYNSNPLSIFSINTIFPFSVSRVTLVILHFIWLGSGKDFLPLKCCPVRSGPLVFFYLCAGWPSIRNELYIVDLYWISSREIITGEDPHPLGSYQLMYFSSIVILLSYWMHIILIPCSYIGNSQAFLCLDMNVSF
jgi:hypothetical protein